MQLNCELHSSKQNGTNNIEFLTVITLTILLIPVRFKKTTKYVII